MRRAEDAVAAIVTAGATELAIALAVAAACCYAVAAWLQQGTVHTVTDGGGSLRLAGWLRLFRTRRWVIGFGLAAIGAGLHAYALSLAPLVVIQPIGVLAIALTTLLAMRSAGSRVTRSAALAVAMSMVGVGLFVVLAVTGPRTSVLASGVELRAGLVSALIVAVLGVVGAFARKRTRCLAFAGAAGVSYGLVSVLVHAIAVRMHVGGLGQLNFLTLGGIVLSLVAGGWFVQHAYASGPPQVVVACQTVIDPMLGVGIGIGLLGEAARMSPLTSVGLVVCAAMAVIGVIKLAGRQASRPDTKSIVERCASDDPQGPLRIVIGADTFPPDINGAAHFAERLARGLAGRGHDVHVLCPATGPRATVETVGDVVLHRVGSRRTPFHPSFRICLPWQAFRAAGALLDELAPDVVHVQAHFLLGRGLVRSAAARGIPIVATNHFMPENLYGHARIPGWLRALAARLGWADLRRVFGDAAVVTAPTPRAVRLLTDNGLPDALSVSCGIDIDRYRRPAPDPRSVSRVLFVGRLDEEKRVDELLRAVAHLHHHVDTRSIDIRVEIVGDGSRRAAWQELSRQLDIAERVHFHGFVDENALVAAYARSTVFCMPGVAELQSLATMEAMAAGKPVIAADAMALPHLVHPGRNGWLYQPGDIAALAGHLLCLLTDQQTCARMGAASRLFIADHALDRTLERFESLYRQVLGRSLVPARRDLEVV
jgi:glycosyltransferase involved in cell wall biosynthesis